MFKTRIRKIWGDVLARRGRTVLVAIAIFIGVTGVIALFSLGDIIVGQLREDLKEDELSMLQVFVSANANASLDNDAYLETLEAVPGVSEVIGAKQNNGFFKLNPDDEDFEEIVLNAYTAPYEPRLPIEPMRLVTGAFPNEDAGEIALEQRMAEDYGLTVGDTIYFRVLSPSLGEESLGEIGTLEPRTISGIVFHPYSFDPDISVYTSIEDASYISGEAGLNLFSARFVDFPAAEAEAENFINTIAGETPYRVIFSTSPQDPAQNELIQTAQTIANTMGFLALIALVVSGFLVINVISSIVVEQKRQIGVMKSMGATRADNFFIYSGIAFVYGLIGVIPGVLVGIWAGNAAAHALAPTLNTVIDGFQVSPPSIITGVLVGLLVPVLASILPVFSGTRVKILDAMTDLGIDANYGNGPIARFIGWLPLPVTIRQGLSNVSLKKSRLAFTVIVLAIAAGAFMGIFAVFSAVSGGLGLFFDSFNVDALLIPNQGREPQEIVRLVEEDFQTPDETITLAVEPGFQLQVEFQDYDPTFSAGGPPGILAYGYDVTSETAPFNLTVIEGNELSEINAANGVVFSSLLAANMDKTIGDAVVMEVPGNSIELTIVGIADFPLDQIWIDWRTLAITAGYTTTTSVDSPEPVPDQFADFVRYITPVTADASQTIAIGLSPEVVAGFATLLDEGEIFGRGQQEVIISSALADSAGYSIGDRLTVESTQDGGETVEYTITGIITAPPQMTLLGLPAEFISASWEELAELDGADFELTPIPQAYFIQTSVEEPTEEQVQAIVDDLNEILLDEGIPSTVINFVTQINQFSQTFTVIQVVLQLVAGLIALVGALGLLTTLFMSVFERQKEIGVMRSIGASSSTVVSQFLTEGLVVGMIAWAIGIPLALAVQRILLSVTGFDETFPATFPVDGVILGLVGMLVITAIASVWPSISAARRTVSDILRYQ